MLKNTKRDEKRIADGSHPETSQGVTRRRFLGGTVIGAIGYFVVQFLPPIPGASQFLPKLPIALAGCPQPIGCNANNGCWYLFTSECQCLPSCQSDCEGGCTHPDRLEFWYNEVRWLYECDCDEWCDSQTVEDCEMCC